MKITEFKIGMKVHDRWFPFWGPGRVVAVLKTRVKIEFRYPPMWAGEQPMTFDREHIQFLEKKG